MNVERGKLWAFRFASDADGKDVQPENTATGIRFSREGHYTLSVFWQKPAPRPRILTPIALMFAMPTTRPSQLHRLLATLALPLALAATAGSAPAQTPKGNLEGTKARCIMNAKQFPNNWKPCRIGPLKGVKDGFFIRFDGTYDAYWGNFRPAPGSQPTTDRRPMVDDQGNRYLMSGHHSFVLEEVGGYGNVIEVAVP